MSRTRLTATATPPRTAGFTLLEIMAAIAIIAIVLVGVYRLYAQSIRMSGAAQFYTVATLLAQEITARIDASPNEQPTDDSGDFEDEYAAYSWKLTVEDLESESFSDADTKPRKIEIQVVYNEDEYSYSLQTLRWFSD
ncbi:MAG: prepilin-type N-terminal cleavage/methylation domain-containing protein [Desulfobacteraceae bacterium]|nr:prepilin-type N-terminal cleavage/methylation domain-containing protein [Desulfobacteraceae bacterium]